MKFTKKALFIASLALGAALTASATEYILDSSDSGALTTIDYVFSNGSTDTFVVTDTQTLTGRLLGADYQTGDYITQTYSPLSGATLTITGGGTLRYNGFSNIDYYYTSYTFTSDTTTTRLHNLYPNSLLVASADDPTSVDTTKTAYSGNLVITGGTTLEVNGFLVQYVRHYSTNNTQGAWVGVQSVTIDENSTISFKSSLEDFNFLKDVHMSNNSVIELGGTSNTLRDDGIIHYSTSQLMIYTSAATESNIGILRGAGSVYFNNSGTVYFGAQAQFATSVAASGDYYSGTSPLNFDTNEWLAYVRSYTQLYETTGESSTGSIADVYLAGGTFNLGLSDSGEVVDNIFVSSTGLSLGMQNAQRIVITHGGREDSVSGNVATYTAYSDWTNSAGTQTTLNIYGTQIINNFQSLISSFNGVAYFSRYGSIAESNADSTTSPYLYAGGVSFGLGNSVVLPKDAVLVLNQDKYRDGIFDGKFLAADADGDNVIIKTGEGNFVYRGTTALDDNEIAISRYYILEGGWYTTAAATNESTLVVGSAGTLVFFQNDATIFSGRIVSDKNAVVRISRSSMEKYYDTKEEVWSTHSTISNGRQNDSGTFEGYYLSVTSNSTSWSTSDDFGSTGSNGYFEVKYTQDQFYGKVEVGAGITLILGSDACENYANAFVNAESIILCGENTGSSRSTLYLGGQNSDSSVQLMNLYYRNYGSSGEINDYAGIGANNRVILNNWATLAWNVRSSDGTVTVQNLTGTAGALVKLNSGTLSITESVGYQGATSVLNGTLNLNTQYALGDINAGLILAGASATQDGTEDGVHGSMATNYDQALGALVGGSGARITATGCTLTIGYPTNFSVESQTAKLANFYLATYNGTEKYFGSTGLNLYETAGLNALTSDELNEMFGSLGANRPEFNGSEITVDDTNDYVADPALLKRTFARAFAVIDSTTWDSLKANFNTTLSLRDYLRSMFSEDNIEAFIATETANANSTWTERRLEMLRAYAKEFIETDGASALEKEGSSTYNLTIANFSDMKDAYALQYLVETLGLDSSLTDATLYNFISALMPSGEEYEFRLTEANIKTIREQYGISVTGNNYQEYEASFLAAIGVPVTDDYGAATFAGTIVGSRMQLVKTGNESLILTGKNRYSGNTIVEGGELRVNYNSIASSPTITVNKGALLTIVSTDEINDIDTDGNLLTTAQFGSTDGTGNSLLRGAGTLLKDGAGTLEIVKALAEKVSDADDFTGAIIVGKDTLQIDITSRELLKSDLYINEDAVLRIELQGVTSDTGETTASTLELSGAIRGNGTLEIAGTGSTDDTLVFSDGDAIAYGGDNSVSLAFDNINAVIQLDGIVGEGDDAFENSSFREDANFDIDAGTTLTIEIASTFGLDSIASPLEYSYNGGMVCAGTLVVSGMDGDDLTDAGTGRTLWFSGDPNDGVVLNLANGELQILNKAVVRIGTAATTTEMTVGTITLGEDSQASLWVDGDLTVGEITINAGTKLASETSNGLITATTFTQIGGDVNDIAGTNFSGTLAITNGGTATFNTLDETLNFAGSITGADGGSYKLVKDGTGTMVFEDGSVTLDFTTADIAINAGTLEMWQATLTTTASDRAFSEVELGAASTLIIHGAEDATTGEKIKLEILADMTGADDAILKIVDGELLYEPNSFNGAIVLDNSKLIVAEADVTEINAIGGNGTVTVERDSNCYDLSVVANSDVTFTGTFEFSNDPDIYIEGSGVWSVAGYDSTGTLVTATFNYVDSIHVGGKYDGGIGISTTGTIEDSSGNAVDIVLHDGAVVALVDEVSTTLSSIEQELTVATGTQNLTLRANGELDLISQSPASILGVSGTISFTLSNFNGDLTVSNISNETALTTYGTEGALILKSGEYDGNIGGNGNLKIAGSVTLNAAQHDFAGTLTVVRGAALTLGTNAKLASEAIVVEAGATLTGGLTTTGTVTLGEVDGNAALYIASVKDQNTISAGTISGTVTVQLVADATDRNGNGYTLFNADDLTNLTVQNPAVVGTGSPLMVIRDTNQITVYVAQNDLREVSSFHEGTGSLVSVLSDFARPDSSGALTGTAEQIAIGTKLNMTSAGALDNTVELLSPLAYASMVAMPAANFANDQRVISQRLEQRLSDNASKAAVWEYNADWEFFAQAQASTTNAGTDHDSMVFDFDTFGVVAGTDRKFSHEFTAGFAVAYDHGKADIHHSGGKIEADDLRLIGFTGLMINDSIAVNLGAEIGFASYDIKRHNGLGNCKDDTTGFHGGLFAEVLTAIPLIEFIDGERIDLLPHAGLALSYYNVGSASESGLGGLDVDRFDALSLQARVGAELAATFTVLEYNTRATFDISIVHEFLDDEVEIDASIAGRSFSTDARAMSQTSLALTPGVMLDLDPKTSVYLNYEFRAGTESVITHSVNVGFRHRF